MTGDPRAANISIGAGVCLGAVNEEVKVLGHPDVTVGEFGDSVGVDVTRVYGFYFVTNCESAAPGGDILHGFSVFLPTALPDSLFFL